MPIGKVGAQHQQHVGVDHRVVAGRKTDQAGHADIIGIIVLDEFLALKRVDDGRLQLCRERYHFVMRTGRSPTHRGS